MLFNRSNTLTHVMCSMRVCVCVCLILNYLPNRIERSKDEYVIGFARQMSTVDCRSVRIAKSENKGLDVVAFDRSTLYV